MKTDTPETNGQTYDPASHPGGWRSFHPDGICVDADFARKLERERDEARLEAAQLRLCLQRVKIYALKIQDVEWGNDGDCGALVLAEYIEEECDKAQSTISKMEIPTQ